MYLHAARCAQCGGKFDDTYRTETYNTSLDRYRGEIARENPYFCSVQCTDAATGKKDSIARRKAAYASKEREIEDLARWLDRSDIDRTREEVNEIARGLSNDLREFAKSLDEAAAAEVEATTRTFFAAYAEKIRAVIETEMDADIDARPTLPSKRTMKMSFADLDVPAMYRTILHAAAVASERIDLKGHFFSPYPEKEYAVLVKLCAQQLGKLTQGSLDGPVIARISALEAASDPIDFLRRAYRIFQRTADGHETFTRRNLRALVNGTADMTDDELWKKIDKTTPPDELLEAIFCDHTRGPRYVIQCQAELRLPDELRFNHTHLLGGTGAGKTTLMQRDILADLQRDDPPGMIIVEPKGMMCQRIRELDVFHPDHGKWRDRLIVLDATDLEAPPALNMFALADPTLPRNVRNQIEAQTIDLLEYVFSSSQFKLTGKQSIGFSFVARLIFNTPGASVSKFFDLLEISEGDFARSEFAPILAVLDEGTQRFFQTDFFGEFADAKDQVRARLYMILRSPELSCMFNASERRIDWFKCIQQRKIILVNTGKEQLGTPASTMFGRYIIASVVAAVGGRTYLDQSEWHPTFLYIDEAQQFVDEVKTQDMLTLVREYRLGITLAHQQMTGVPMNDNMRSAISTNTGVKYAAGVEAQDLRLAAQDLRCEPEFIQAQTITKTHVQFACFVRNHPFAKTFTTTAAKTEIKSQPRMDAEALAQSIARNRALVGSLPSAPPPKPTPVKVVAPIVPDAVPAVEQSVTVDDPFDL